MLGNKTIVDAFNTSWEQCVMAAACDARTDVFPEQRILLRRVFCGEFIAVYGDANYPTYIITRWSLEVMGLIVLVHLIFQEITRLKKHGICSRLVYQDGVLSCVYLSGGAKP